MRDESVYRIVYRDNGVPRDGRFYSRGGIASILARQGKRPYFRKYYRVERAPQPQFEDVTEMFLGGKDA